MKRNCLVIGGAGFIGSYLSKELLKVSDKVVVIDNLLRGKVENIKDLQNDPKFKFLIMDVNEVDKLINLLKDEDINYVFHLAANSDIQASALNPSIEFEYTAKSTWSTLFAMREVGVKNLFFASTSAVYGELKGEKFSEESLLEPVSYYGSAKVASEAFIRSYSYMNDFNALIFRFPNVIGPNLTHGVFFDFINRLKENPHQLVVLGDGSQSKPYMHVSDLVNAILSLVWNNNHVNIYNVGVAHTTSVKKIAEMVVKEMNLTNCKIIYGKENIGWKGDVPHFEYNLDKIHSTGWKALLDSDEASLLTIKEALHK